MTGFVYIWDSVPSLTSYYHSRGGLVVVADSIEDARAAASKEVLENYGIEEGPVDDIEPDVTLALSQNVQYRGVHIFPDSGCC